MGFQSDNFGVRLFRKSANDNPRTRSDRVIFQPDVDLALIIVLVLSAGVLLSTHVSLSVELARLGPWYRGLLAFVLPPLAPFWGYHGKLHTRSLIWIIAVTIHVACLTAAAIGGST
ncbi:MAG TPA: hypothetical protein VHV51_26220 [Polyangiaceae bacterium]|nr:hypothetical protein [Polyangiaceae bacterium]